MGRHELDEPVDTIPVPSMDPDREAAARRDLRRHKAGATGLLAVAFIIFIACLIVSKHDPSAQWVGFVKAAAEAGMVGGLADWFAVTALFSHPLGLKIPHTAIVKKNKDRIGESLSTFVGENFLNAELLTAKVRAAGIPNRLGVWLREPDHARVVSRQVASLASNAVKAIDPHDAETIIRSLVIDKASEPAWGPILGRVVDELTAEGRFDPLVDQLAGWLHTTMLGSEDFIISTLDERRPEWAPKFVGDLIGAKVYDELVSWSAAVATDHNHKARRAFMRMLAKLSDDLQHDPATIAKVESFKAEVMASRAVSSAPGAIWKMISSSVIAAAESEDSLLRVKLEQLAMRWGNNLTDDASLRQDLDRKLTGAAAFVANNYAGEITSIISETIARWDADEAAEKIELKVGKDLQFIRVNGTVVGALAGELIYVVSFIVTHL